jgi:hypothetical protein
MTKISAISNRTAYQSESFKNLQQLKRKPTLNTLEALLNANFTIEALFSDDCSMIRQMCEDRGIPEYVLIDIPISLSDLS